MHTAVCSPWLLTARLSTASPKDTHPISSSPHPMTSFNPNYFLSPHGVALGVRASMSALGVAGGSDSLAYGTLWSLALRTLALPMRTSRLIMDMVLVCWSQFLRCSLPRQTKPSLPVPPSTAVPGFYLAGLLTQESQTTLSCGCPGLQCVK